MGQNIFLSHFYFHPRVVLVVYFCKYSKKIVNARDEENVRLQEKFCPNAMCKWFTFKKVSGANYFSPLTFSAFLRGPNSIDLL